MYIGEIMWIDIGKWKLCDYYYYVFIVVSCWIIKMLLNYCKVLKIVYWDFVYF